MKTTADARPRSRRPGSTLLCSAALFLCSAALAWSQQANVNLEHDPQRNKENLTPFSATLNSPDVHDDGTVTFRLKAPEAKDVKLAGWALLAFPRESLFEFPADVGYVRCKRRSEALEENDDSFEGFRQRIRILAEP